MLDTLFQFAEGFKAASDLYLARMIRDEKTIRELRAALKDRNSKLRLVQPSVSFCFFFVAIMMLSPR